MHSLTICGMGTCFLILRGYGATDWHISSIMKMQYVHPYLIMMPKIEYMECLSALYATTVIHNKCNAYSYGLR